MSRIADQLGLHTEADVAAFNSRRNLRRLSTNGVTPLSEAADRAIEQAAVFTPESPAPRVGVKGVIRQSAKQPNKTETRFELEHLRPWQAAGRILGYEFESITLKLGNGVRYTPDWVAYHDAGGGIALAFYEIKGAKVWDDAKVKLKLAPKLFPHFTFFLCAWDAATGWAISEVLA